MLEIVKPTPRESAGKGGNLDMTIADGYTSYIVQRTNGTFGMQASIKLAFVVTYSYIGGISHIFVGYPL